MVVVDFRAMTGMSASTHWTTFFRSAPASERSERFTANVWIDAASADLCDHLDRTTRTDNSRPRLPGIVPSPLSRRALLGVVGTTGLASIAGCGSVLGSDGKRLYQLWVENLDDAPHTLHVIVEYDGELTHWSSTPLPGAGTVEVDSREYRKARVSASTTTGRRSPVTS